VAAGICYNAYFGTRYGTGEGISWFTGYLLEWMLSIDNVFVFHLVFKVYRTPEHLMHRALFAGVVGGIVLRLFVFCALGMLLQVIHWVRIVFGVVLIWSGVQAVSDNGEEEDVANTFAVRSLKALLGTRLHNSYDQDGRLFPTGADGKVGVSLLFFIVVLVECVDIVFAVDSVSAKVAQIQNQYTAYSSSVMAVFALRALFFVIRDMVEHFELLKYGICIILVFIGVELIASPFLHLESATVCCVIGSVFLVSIMSSTARNMWTGRHTLPYEAEAARRLAPAGWSGAKAYDAS